MDEEKVIARVGELVREYSARDLEAESAARLIQFLTGARLNKVFAHLVEQQIQTPPGLPEEKLAEYRPLLAEAYFDDGQFDKALARYDELVQHSGPSPDPQVARAKLRAAECLIHLRRFDEAKARHAELQQSRRGGEMLTPLERSFAQDRVRTAIRQGKFPAARQLLEDHLLKYPSVLEEDHPFLWRGKINMGERKWEAAVTDFEFLERLEPRSNHLPEALFLAGQCQAALGKTAEAVKLFERVSTRYGNSPFAEPARKELEKLKR